MSLILVAVPIGNPADFSQRALETLTRCPVVIFEERKEGSRILREQGISGKQYFELNEHSTPADIKELVQLCHDLEVALITDAGTPGFCDPGANLVGECRKRSIPVRSIPGPSSLMMILSLSSQRLDQFVFRGFLPAENEARAKEWAELKKEKRAFVIMDTPYRLQKMLQEVSGHLSDRKVLVGLDFTHTGETVWEGLGRNCLVPSFPKKAEFMILVYPK